MPRCNSSVLSGDSVISSSRRLTRTVRGRVSGWVRGFVLVCARVFCCDGGFVFYVLVLIGS